MLFPAFLLTIALVLIHSAIGAPSPDEHMSCNKLPLAESKDFSGLMKTYLKNNTVVPCGDAKRVTLTQGSCSIVYKCPDDVQSIAVNRTVAYAVGLKDLCRYWHPDLPSDVTSAASVVASWGRVCYMKAGK